jgi:hypothetical protein
LCGEGDANCMGLLWYADGTHISPSRHTAENGMDCVGDKRGFHFDFIEEEGRRCM